MSIHIEAIPGEIAETVLITGDPLRAKFIAETMLTGIVCYNNVRGMLGYTGIYKEQRVSVQGTGMGIPSTAIYVHELIHDYKVRRIIRVGTCGAIQPGLHVGQTIIADSAYTDSSAFRMDVVTMENGIRAHQDLVRNALAVAGALSQLVATGPVFSTDVFYDNPSRWELWGERGVLGVEMETSVIYLLAQQNNVEALTLLTISDHILTGNAMTSLERQETGRSIMQLALDTAITPF